MSFVEWTFLFGGLAVAGPAIAHLLARPRFRRLPFTMLRFLRSGQVESQSRRKLRDLLILLLRCAIIVLIAMLFARPLLHVNPNSEQNGNIFFLGLDNSMSMAYSDSESSYFDRMVDEAIDYIRSAEADAGAPVFNTCALASGNWSRDLSREQALAEVKAMKIEPSSTSARDFLSPLARANRTENSRNRTVAAVLSDFTPQTLRQFVSIEEPAHVDKIDYRLVASTEPVDNAAIADAHIIGLGDGKLSINATVVNYGQTDQDRRLSARTGSNSTGPVEIKLSPGKRRTYQVQIDVPGAAQDPHFLPVELNLSGSDGLKEDDAFYLAVSVPGKRNVNILIAGDNPTQLFLLKTAMDTLSGISSYGELKIGQAFIGDLGRSDLDWADVVVCSTISERMDALASEVQSFVNAGGRFITFVTEKISPAALGQLWRRDVLAAMPGKSVHQRTYLEAKPRDNRSARVDNEAAKSLANYRVDRILMKGYLECTPHAKSKCLWQFQDGTGFICIKEYGSGCSLLVNTSVDDSLGTLTKSSASVAFCQYLLGQSSRISEYCFGRDERVLLPVPNGNASPASQKEYWVETCDGRRHRAAVADSSILVPDPAGIGWVKTLGKPATYAGVNVPQGETDMTKPVADELARVMTNVFPENAEDLAEAGTFDHAAHKPLWRILAWMIIVLLLVEPLVANRLKR